MSVVPSRLRNRACPGYGSSEPHSRSIHICSCPHFDARIPYLLLQDYPEILKIIFRLLGLASAIRKAENISHHLGRGCHIFGIRYNESKLASLSLSRPETLFSSQLTTTGFRSGVESIMTANANAVFQLGA